MLYEVQPALGNAHRIPSAYFLSDTGSYLVKPILGDPGADSGGEGKSKQAEK